MKLSYFQKTRGHFKARNFPFTSCAASFHFIIFQFYLSIFSFLCKMCQIHKFSVLPFADVNKSSNRECDNESCKSTSKQCIDTSWWEFISLLDLMNFIFDEWILKERIFFGSRVWKNLDFYVKMVEIWRMFQQKLTKIKIL